MDDSVTTRRAFGPRMNKGFEELMNYFSFS